MVHDLIGRAAGALHELRVALGIDFDRPAIVLPMELIEPDDYRSMHPAGAPHCDARILHEPGLCSSCDLFPDWQLCRERWGIAFTGNPASDEQWPCPADLARPPGSDGDHQQWPGNTAYRFHRASG